MPNISSSKQWSLRSNRALLSMYVPDLSLSTERCHGKPCDASPEAMLLLSYPQRDCGRCGSYDGTVFSDGGSRQKDGVHSTGVLYKRGACIVLPGQLHLSPMLSRL
mmetsp:Transcript_31337/g.57465  ORF Transcript_31337/g.57465 Transcript_31337/m.57465 type:complete len:106 (-) Transcript_31337:917-1234(-)